MTWSAAQYTRFEEERTRPARDLVAQLPAAGVARAIDLGCGPGNSTALLVERFAQAAVSGLDSSPDMLAAARRRLPDVRFVEGDIAQWDGAGGPFDVIFANASLQWLHHHERLLPALSAHLAPGGRLAVQMPDNLDEPTHALMRAVAAEGPWAARLAGAAGGRAPRHPAEWYYRLLTGLGLATEVWRTTYFHPLAGAPAVVEWLQATGLRPFIQPLDPPLRAAFLERYQAAIAAAYPALPDGSVLLPFPRLFIVAGRV